MIANHLWQSIVFAALAVALAYAFRRQRAGVRFWIWMAASLKFLAAFALLMNTGGRLPAPPPTAVALVGPTAAIVDSAVLMVPVESRSDSWRPALLLAIWTGGFLLVIARWVWRWRRTAASPALEPGVFGVFRPKLMLPPGIEQRLTPEQMRAIVAHEMCHVRRRDNLLAAMHMAWKRCSGFTPQCGGLARGSSRSASARATKRSSAKGRTRRLTPRESWRCASYIWSLQWPASRG